MKKNLLQLEFDVWSLRCILLELFTGNIVFWADKEKDACTLICQLCGTPDETDWPMLLRLLIMLH
jgi:cyclin-dependent kinase 12/13